VHRCALHRVRNTRAPADAGKLIDEEVEKWGKVIRSGSIKAQ